MAKKAKAVSASKKSASKSKLTPTKKPAPFKKPASKKTSASAKKPEVVNKAVSVKATIQGKQKTPEKIAKVISQTETTEPLQVIERTTVVEVEKSEKPIAPKKSKATRAAESKEKAAKQASSDEEARWVDIYEKNKGEKPLDYDMKRKYESNKPLQHKILGWGWILSSENDRLEVLFKDGKKILISNYNS